MSIAVAEVGPASAEAQYEKTYEVRIDLTETDADKTHSAAELAIERPGAVLPAVCEELFQRFPFLVGGDKDHGRVFGIATSGSNIDLLVKYDDDTVTIDSMPRGGQKDIHLLLHPSDPDYCRATVGYSDTKVTGAEPAEVIPDLLENIDAAAAAFQETLETRSTRLAASRARMAQLANRVSGLHNPQ